MVILMDVPVGEDLLDRALAECREVPAEDLAVVFPGRRAVHHFAKRYAASRGGPCRPPGLFTMESLTARLAGVRGEALEEARAVALLSEAMASTGGPVLKGLASDLVTFYGWGAAFLEALETLGEELVPEEDLRRLRGLETFDSLSPPVREFYERLTGIREAFEERVSASRSFTRGGVYARALSRLQSGTVEVPGRVLFVGFFSLTRGQTRLTEALGRAIDVRLLRHHDGRRWEAFETAERALSPGWTPRPAPCDPPALEVRAAPGIHAEALYAGSYIEGAGGDPESTVVVLPDAGSLLPLLWDGLSSFPGEFNVTLGYPLARTPLFTLLQRVLELAEESGGERVSARPYLDLLLHPYVKNLSVEGHGPGALRPLAHVVEEHLLDEGRPRILLRDLEGSPDLPRRARSMQPDGPDEGALATALRRLHDLFIRRVRDASTLEGLTRALRAVVEESAHRSPAPFHPFYRDCFARAVSLLDGLAQLPSSAEEASNRPALLEFMRARLREARVPFTGLPVRGLQVMGVLETQALRFDTVVVMDASEDVLPSAFPPDPVLPPSFRKALGLPGALEREEVYRYHVFRLLESARRCCLLHLDRPESGRSHFVDQLLFEARLNGRDPSVRSLRLAAATSAARVPSGAVKSADLVGRLSAMAYSPTALDAYLRCPMAFYYGHAAGLRERETLEEADPKGTGRRLHALLADLYGPHAGKALKAEAYDEMLERLPGRVTAHLGMTGASVLTGMLAERRIGEILRREKEEETGEVFLHGVELPLEAPFDVPGATVVLRGKVDRLDGGAAGLRIVDYKMGKSLKSKYLPRPDRILVQAPRRELARAVQSIQLPAYVEILRRVRGEPFERVSAVLVSLRDPKEAPAALFGDPARAEAEMDALYLPVIRRILGEILDPSLPFEPDPSEPRACATCPFSVLCGS